MNVSYLLRLYLRRPSIGLLPYAVFLSRVRLCNARNILGGDRVGWPTSLRSHLTVTPSRLQYFRPRLEWTVECRSKISISSSDRYLRTAFDSLAGLPGFARHSRRIIIHVGLHPVLLAVFPQFNMWPLTKGLHFLASYIHSHADGYAYVCQIYSQSVQLFGIFPTFLNLWHPNTL